MKNTIKILICLVIIVVSLFINYTLLAKYHEEHQYDTNRIEARKIYEPSSVLCGAIEKKNWDDLALSENFRKKYKSRNDIIPNIETFSKFSNGYDDNNGKKCIVIIADTPASIFDPYGERKTTTYFYFDYKSIEDRELDDIILVKTEKVNSFTGEEIKIEKSN